MDASLRAVLDSNNVPSCLRCSQIGFITNIVQPMLKEKASLVPHTAALALADCASNVQYYQAQQ